MMGRLNRDQGAICPVAAAAAAECKRSAKPGPGGGPCAREALLPFGRQRRPEHAHPPPGPSLPAVNDMQ